MLCGKKLKISGLHPDIDSRCPTATCIGHWRRDFRVSTFEDNPNMYCSILYSFLANHSRRNFLGVPVFERLRHFTGQESFLQVSKSIRATAPRYVHSRNFRPQPRKLMFQFVPVQPQTSTGSCNPENPKIPRPHAINLCRIEPIALARPVC